MEAVIKVNTFVNGEYVRAGQIVSGKVAEVAVKTGVAEKTEKPEPKKSGQKTGGGGK